MKLAEQGALIAAQLEQPWKGDFVRVHHVIRKVVASESGKDVGTKWVATCEERRPPVGARRHRPHVVELDASASDRFDIRG